MPYLRNYERHWTLYIRLNVSRRDSAQRTLTERFPVMFPHALPKTGAVLSMGLQEALWRAAR